MRANKIRVHCPYCGRVGSFHFELNEDGMIVIDVDCAKCGVSSAVAW